MEVKIVLTPEVSELLDYLVKTGLFGKTRAGVAEELMRAKLREEIIRPRVGASKHRGY